MREGLNEDETIYRIVADNLFQYPTEKSIRQMAKACVRRLKVMGDEDLIEAVASQSSETAKQICSCRSRMTMWPDGVRRQ